LLYFTLLVLVGGLLAGHQQMLQTVPQVDLTRYVGTWYVIARLPNWFQDQCVANVTADYRLSNDNSIKVVNQCLDREG
jgi:apolipoprotein D and lipocalin family protein